MRGHWTRGKRRKDCDASRFITALLTEWSAAEIAAHCGVSERTLRRWARGEDWCSSEVMLSLVEQLLPDVGRLPIYSPDMALDGGSHVAGVSDYSLRAARGDPCTYLE